MEISALEAANRLGVDVATVRRRAARGQIAARKVGNAWLFSDAEIAASSREPASRGRRLSARSAWAVLDVLSGVPLQGLSRSEQVRARSDAGHLSRGDLAERAVIWRLRGPKGARERLARDQRLVLGGVSAGSQAGLGIVAPDLVEGYVRGEDLDAVLSAFAFVPASRERADVVLRVPKPRWPFGDARMVSPPVAAADVLDAGDSRSVAAARAVLARAARQIAE